MTCQYYWERLIPADELRAVLSVKAWDYQLVDCVNEPDSSYMKKSYPTYIQRRYRIYQNGSCVGYTTQAVIDELGLDLSPRVYLSAKEGGS